MKGKKSSVLRRLAAAAGAILLITASLALPLSVSADGGEGGAEDHKLFRVQSQWKGLETDEDVPSAELEIVDTTTGKVMQTLTTSKEDSGSVDVDDADIDFTHTYEVRPVAVPDGWEIKYQNCSFFTEQGVGGSDKKYVAKIALSFARKSEDPSAGSKVSISVEIQFAGALMDNPEVIKDSGNKVIIRDSNDPEFKYEISADRFEYIGNNENALSRKSGHSLKSSVNRRTFPPGSTTLFSHTFSGTSPRAI